MGVKKVSIIGGGISGVSLGQLLKNDFAVNIYEKEASLGGLIRCKEVDGILFHKVGGHVFNSKNQDVLEWFWKHFDREQEFFKVIRDARIFMGGEYLSYPLENNIYKFDKTTVEKIVNEIVSRIKSQDLSEDNFYDFLISRFGPTLCDLYFFPYNNKIWQYDLKKMPLPWLDGKLPMPNYQQILVSNIMKLSESEMVHATFYYPKKGGSQFIIDRLAKGLNVCVSTPVYEISAKERLMLNSQFESDAIVYCGDVRKLPTVLGASIEISATLRATIENLPSNGTSNILCEFDGSDLSWLYFPEMKFKNHRIINTGNFSINNNGQSQRKTCVVEFSGKHSLDEMKAELKKLPGNLKHIDHNYEANSYIIHDFSTRQAIAEFRSILEKRKIYLLGRFAEWEYYNMDKCIESAMLLKQKIVASLK